MLLLHYNGILGSSINGTRTITDVDFTGYKFQADSAMDSAIDFGGSLITATQQYRMDTAQLQMMEKKPGNTDYKLFRCIHYFKKLLGWY